MKDIKEIVWLIGAGVSTAAGMDSTETITKYILDEKYFDEAIYQLYRMDKDQYKEIEFDNRVYKFISLLKRTIDESRARYMSANSGYEKKSNYEDIFYLLGQLDGYINNNPDYSLIHFLYERIKKEVEPLEEGKDRYDHSWCIDSLIRDTNIYINSSLIQILSKKVEALSALRPIIDSCSDDCIDMVDIFSLNHDLVMEDVFHKAKLDYFDGSTEDRGDYYDFDPLSYSSTGKKVRLCKLHGSIDLCVISNESDVPSRVVKQKLPLKTHFVNDSNGKRYSIERRAYLVGTQNKRYSYTLPFYSALFTHFDNALQKSNNLIICGYGFGDSGVNQKLVSWMNLNPNKKLLIIHPEPDTLFLSYGKLLGIANRWNQDQRLFYIRKKIEQTSWDEIKGTLQQ